MTPLGSPSISQAGLVLLSFSSMTKEAFFARHTKLTRSLKKFVLDYESQLEPEVFAAFLNSMSEELQSATNEIMKAPEGPARARRLHELVEQEIQQGADIEVSCKKGCSACCHMEVEITNYEARILVARLYDGREIDFDRFEKQSQRELQDKAWRRGPGDQMNRCVFLDKDGACGVYEERPVMCRRHSVTSPAGNCEDISLSVVLRYFPRVDLLISASNEDPELRIGPLAKMIVPREG